MLTWGDFHVDALLVSPIQWWTYTKCPTNTVLRLCSPGETEGDRAAGLWKCAGAEEDTDPQWCPQGHAAVPSGGLRGEFLQLFHERLPGRLVTSAFEKIGPKRLTAVDLALGIVTGIIMVRWSTILTIEVVVVWSRGCGNTASIRALIPVGLLMKLRWKWGKIIHYIMSGNGWLRSYICSVSN